MNSLRGGVLLVIAVLACAPEGKPARNNRATEPEEDAAIVVDAKTTPKDTKPSTTPDVSAPKLDTAPEPIVDAGASTPDSDPTDAPPVNGPDASTGVSPDGGTGGNITEAMWSLTGCNQATLMFPNIDKNMGKFPPGSCPPPETLKRDCGGNSKIAVMTATSSPFETGYVHPPSYATDQYLMTRWSSNSGPTAWLAMDLGSEQTFKRLYLAWELAHATDYDIVVSNDGTTWMPLKQVRGGNGFQDIVDVEGKARYVRINGVTRGRTGAQLYGYSLFDVVICGERP